MATKIVSNQFSWAATAVAWMPLDDWVHNFPSAPSRTRGRPPKRWDQALASFSCTYFGERNWWVAAQNCNQWLAAEAAFVKYCESMWRTKGSPCPFRIEVTRTGERKKERKSCCVTSNRRYDTVKVFQSLWNGNPTVAKYPPICVENSWCWLQSVVNIPSSGFFQRSCKHAAKLFTAGFLVNNRYGQSVGCLQSCRWLGLWCQNFCFFCIQLKAHCRQIFHKFVQQCTYDLVTCSKN